MSKLPNAPLIEVIFELRWKVTTKEELEKCQYLHGDLYALLKNEFKFRESLVAPALPLELFSNLPAHRFRVAQNEYPLIQVGPGLITVNTIDSNYNWGEFELLINNTIKKFFEVYKFLDDQEITLAIQYLDFLSFDFENENILDFLSKNLNLTISQNFFDNNIKANNLNLSFNYNTELGSLLVSFTRGKNNFKADGIVIRTALQKAKCKSNILLIKEWLNDSHEFCSKLFKDMTKGNLYESFSKK
jgi:uncharacterized protein (TIGR04255 family)